MVYSYSVNSFLAELVDLTDQTTTSKRLPVLWDTYMAGLQSSSPRVNQTLVIRAIDQAFNESPYLTNQ